MTKISRGQSCSQTKIFPLEDIPMSETSITIIIVVALFVIAIVAFLIVFRSKGSIKFKGPFGTKLNATGSNEPDKPTPPGAVIEHASSRRGGARAEDHTGRGARISDVDVEDDIVATSDGPKTKKRSSQQSSGNAHIENSQAGRDNVSISGDNVQTGGTRTIINTGGGTHIDGDVNIQGGDFVGRDKKTQP